MTYKEVFKEVLRIEGNTQTDVANKIGITRQSVSSRMTNLEVKLKNVTEMAEALGWRVCLVKIEDGKAKKTIPVEMKR